MYYTKKILLAQNTAPEPIPEPAGYWVHKDTLVQTDFDMTAAWISGTTFNRPSWYADASIVKIPEGVTHIFGTSTTDAAFFAAVSLVTVFLPSTLTSLGMFAFCDCANLELSSLPSGITLINNEAFGSCPKITISEIPAGETALRYGLFYACTSLVSLKLGANITMLANYSLSGCTSLTSLELNSITPPTLESEAFSGSNNIASIKVPSASVDAYKAAPGWSARANIITAI